MCYRLDAAAGTSAEAFRLFRVECEGGLKEILAIWDVLFPQLKHEALKRMVKEVKYDGMTGKLDITLNH